MIRRRRSGALALALLLVLLGGCAGTDEPSTPVGSCTLPPAIEAPAGLPADLPWPEGVELTEARSNKRFVALVGFGRGSVDYFFERGRIALEDNRFDIINTDYEGFEAELYFAKGNSLAGITSLREGPCDGHVRVNVVYDPLETAAGREAVRKTRKLSGEGSKSP